ncbi:MAG: hypothetical protein AAF410_00125 [Pseudomonadota bacterium]
MSLFQSLTETQTLFALICYCLSILIALPLFETIHEKIEQGSMQYIWNKIGMPIVRALLLMLFILLAYPVSFGLERAPALSELMNVESERMNIMFNLLFLITFIYPIVPIIGKADALMIPLQGMIALIILFYWLAEKVALKEYSLLPDPGTGSIIIVLCALTYFFAKHISIFLGQWLDNTFHREGYQVLVFHAVIMIMQTPVIYLYGHALGKQLNIMP